MRVDMLAFNRCQAGDSNFSIDPQTPWNTYFVCDWLKFRHDCIAVELYQLSRGVTLTPSLVFTQQYVCLSLWWVCADDKQWSRLALVSCKLSSLASWKLSSLASWKLSSDECRNSNSETVTHKHTHARLSRLRRVAAALFRLSWRLNFTLINRLCYCVAEEV